MSGCKATKFTLLATTLDTCLRNEAMCEDWSLNTTPLTQNPPGAALCSSPFSCFGSQACSVMLYHLACRTSACLAAGQRSASGPPSFNLLEGSYEGQQGPKNYIPCGPNPTKKKQELLHSFIRIAVASPGHGATKILRFRVWGLRFRA